VAGDYADVERILVTWLETATGIRTVTEAPADIIEDFIQVEAFGGADRNPGIDVANVDVDFYAVPTATGEPDRGAARDGAELVRRKMLRNLPGHVVTFDGVTATVAAVATISRPTARPWDESNIRRFHAAYRVTVQSSG
jgi:hypothetical protein